MSCKSSDIGICRKTFSSCIHPSLLWENFGFFELSFCPPFFCLYMKFPPSGMDTIKENDKEVTCLKAIAEREVQGACVDACSICLEDFSESDPSTVTDCKHEYHLHCILEWCHRSSNCPMCWQPITFRDAASQELLEAVEHEKSLKINSSRNFTLHLPTDGSEIDLEEHIFQHLAASAAMRSGYHVFQRGGQGVGLSLQGHHPILNFSGPIAPHDAVNSVNTIRGGSNSIAESSQNASTTNQHTPVDQVPVSLSQPQMGEASVHGVGSNVASANPPRVLSEARFASQPSRRTQNTRGTSDMHSVSESLRSRLNAWSMRYKESISRNTRSWKERLFARSSTSMADLSTEVRREVNSGVGISRIVERLDIRRNNGSSHASQSSHTGSSTSSG